MDEMSKTIMDIQEYFDNKTQRHVSEEGTLAIDRYTGTIDFAVRVYEYGRMHVSDDPASYLNYTKIAMDNLMEFLSVNYPKIANPEYKSAIDAHVQKFLTYMAIELHSFIKKYYDTWQKNYPYVFRDFAKVREKGPFAFYPIYTSHYWNTKRMDPSTDKNREGFNKYPKLYYDIIVHKNTSGIDLRYFYEVKEFFPGAGMIKDGAPIEDCIDLPLVEEDFDLSEYFRTHVSEWKEDYLKKAQSFENPELYTIPTFARCIPNARVDEVGQDGDYDLVVNTSNLTMRYSAVISYIRSSHQLAYSEEIPKYTLKNRPSFGNATFFQVPYPEILAVDEFVYNIPNTILFISKNDGSTLPDDSIFKNLIDRMKEKSVENKVNTNLVYTKWYDILISHHPNKSRLFETPGVPWRFLFHPLENLQKKKIRTVFISLYRLGENRYLIERLEDLVRKGVFVYAYIEPTARGDEKANQKIIKELKEAGVHVKHSCHGLKVHMKAWQIIYDDNSLLSMISTGNFNTKTMGQYVDLHYITTEEKTNLELLYLFKILFSGGDFKSGYDWWMDFNNRNLFITPISAKGKLKDSIRVAVSDDNDIFLKCNNFTDPSFLDSFVIPNYSGNARFMIRTSTVFSPVSKNMEARSKVSKYLEHSRLYVIGDEVFISSADLMKRNMKKRLEILLKLPLGKSTNVYQRFNVFDNMVDIGEGTPIDEYINKIWDSCNYQLDKLSLKWRIRT